MQIKPHERNTAITLDKPTTEINIMGNHKITKVSQDKLGRTYIWINPRTTQKNKLTKYTTEK
jgi:hypothetical protein